MIIRQRTKSLFIAGGIGALLILVISLISFYFLYASLVEKEQQKRLVYEEQYHELLRQLEEQELSFKSVYVLNQDIEAGTRIEASMLEKIEVPAAIIPQNTVVERDAIGKYTKLDILQNTPLTEAMLFREGILPHDVRHVEFSFIELPSRLKEGHFVDVRIKFPTGHDYIVLAKKRIEELFDQTVRYEVDEEEILTMSSAIVDAYLHNATLYAVTYVDPYTQAAAEVTCPVKAEVLELIEINPNIVNFASAGLEFRNRSKLEADLQKLDESAKMSFTNVQAQAQVRQETDKRREAEEIPQQDLIREDQHFTYVDVREGYEDLAAIVEEQSEIFESEANTIPYSP
jgi:hypothetical protein